MTKFIKLDIQKFATSGDQKVTSSSGNYGYIKAEFSESNPVIATNKSTITAKATLTRKTGSWSGIGKTSLQIWWYDNNAHANGTKIAELAVPELAYGNTGNSVSVSGSIDVPHKDDGSLSGYAKTVWYFGGTFQHTYDDGEVSTVNTTLTKIARQANLTAAPDFNDEGNPVITYSNPAGNSVTALDACISWTGADDIAYRSISKTGTSYTFSFTDAERKKLREACSTKDSMTVKFYVRTTLGGTSYYSTITKTFSIINATPTVSAAYEETNTTAKKVIGSNAASYVIKGISQPKITLSPSVKKEATLASLKISDGTTNATSSPYTFLAPTGGSFTYEITDSRGKKASGSLSKTFVNYFTPSISSSQFSFKSITDSTIVANATATYFNGSLGFKTSNPLTITILNSAGTVVKTLTSSEYSVSGNNITISNLSIGQSGADKVGQSYTLRIADTFDKAESSNILSAAVPTFEAGKDCFQINGTLYLADSTRSNVKTLKATMVDTIYPVGAIYMSVNSTSPASLFGGTWAQLKDRFLVGTGDTYSNGATGGAASASHSHTVNSHNHSVPGVSHSHTNGSLLACITFDAQTGIATRWTTSRGGYTATGLKKATQVVNNNSSWWSEGTEVNGTTAATTPAGTTSGNSSPGTNAQTVATIPPYLAVYMWKRTK